MKAEDAFAVLRGDGQPWLFVVFSVLIATSADKVRNLIGWTVYGETPPAPLPAGPPIDAWAKLYRRHRAMQDGIGRGLGFSADDSASALLGELRAGSKLPPEEIEAEIAKFSPKEQVDLIRPYIGIPFPPDDATLRAMLEEFDADAEPADAEDDTLLDALFASPAGQFFFRVWWPCWILYREFPPRLLREARLGDLDALDKLLRLDKLIISEPRIARVIHRVMTTGTASEQRRITQALSCRPKVQLTDKAIRAGLGALISQLATLFHTKVTAPEIQGLFDAIERVRSGNPADQAVPPGEAWSKAIQRNRNWPEFKGH